MSVAALFRLILTIFTFCRYFLKCNADECANLISNYTMRGDLKDKNSTEFILSSLSDKSTAECVVACEEMFLCVLFIYNPLTRECSLHSRNLTDPGLTLEAAAGSLCFEADDVEESWVVNITGNSGYHYPPSNMIGQPDSNPWKLSRADEPGYAELQFASELLIEQIRIHEREYAGGVSKISLLTPDGTWYPVWITAEVEVLSPRIWSPDLMITHFKTSSVRIDVGPRTAHERIDAVQVVGKERRLTKRVKFNINT